MVAVSALTVAGVGVQPADASGGQVTAREAATALATVSDLTADTVTTSATTRTDAVVTDTVAIPRRAADGVDIAGLTVRLPGAADDAPAVKLDAGTVVYPSPGSYANAVQATDDGLRALVVIETPNAPVDYRFIIDGATHLVANPDGTIDVHNGDTRVVVVEPAWARDRNGAIVPTEYRIDGTTIIQTVHHHGAAHPVVADPKYSWGWTQTTVHFTRGETNALAFGIGLAALLANKWGWIAAGPPGAVALYAGWALNAGACLRLIINQWQLNYWFSHYYGPTCR